MPTYQYECKDCHHRFDLFQKFSEDALTMCPTCEGTVRRVIQNVGVVFKGSGWYINDSRPSSKESSSSDNGQPDKPSTDSPPAEKPAVESKSAAKSEKPAKPEKGSTPAPAAST
jgi:putative FmdB family regulatory protein